MLIHALRPTLYLLRFAFRAAASSFCRSFSMRACSFFSAAFAAAASLLRLFRIDATTVEDQENC